MLLLKQRPMLGGFRIVEMSNRNLNEEHKMRSWCEYHEQRAAIKRSLRFVAAPKCVSHDQGAFLLQSYMHR